MDPHGNAIAHIHRSLYSAFITQTQSMLLIEVHSTCCSINAPACWWSSASTQVHQQITSKKPQPRNPGIPETNTAVIQSLPRNTPQPGFTQAQSKHATHSRQAPYMSPIEYCEVTSTTATELHNKPPNHQLAARNLSSSCEQTPTPGWRRECREDGWRT